MFWLYFARDFYRAGSDSSGSAALSSHPRSIVAAVVFRAHEPVAKPKIAGEIISRATISAKSAPLAEQAGPQRYVQRLSVEGDHAFGIWTEEAGFSLFSANFERVTGLSTQECAGHDWIDAIHHDQQYALNEALIHAQTGKDSRCLVQAARYTQPNTGWRWLMLDVKAATTRDPSIMVLWRDISEQKALEEALAEMRGALALSDRGRSAFLSSMSHELRTPLNAIMGFSEMMKSGVFGDIGNDTYKQYTKHIHDSGNHLLGKINDLLDIANMDAGGLEVEESEFFLPELLAEIIEIHSHHAFARGQQLEFDCPMPLSIIADRTKLLCAVNHLVANALRHSAEGGTVTLNVRHQADEGIILSVHDTGEGIPTAQLEIIRQAFEAEAAYFKIEPGGIGLGLSLAKELAARHGGRVMIDSMRYRGTVVSLTLPTSRIASGLPTPKRKKSALPQNFELVSG